MHHERGYRTPFGDTMWWRTGEDATGGGYSLHERIAPPGSASFAHVHGRLSEAFYVLSGRCTFTIGDGTVSGEAGTFVIAPPGTRHAWRVDGDSEARMLVVFTPSAQRVYFEELDALVERSGGPPDGADLRALAVKYGWD